MFRARHDDKSIPLPPDMRNGWPELARVIGLTFVAVTAMIIVKRVGAALAGGPVDFDLTTVEAAVLFLLPIAVPAAYLTIAAAFWPITRRTVGKIIVERVEAWSDRELAEEVERARQDLSDRKRGSRRQREDWLRWLEQVREGRRRRQTAAISPRSVSEG